MFKRMFGKSESKGGEKMKLRMVRILFTVLGVMAMFGLISAPALAATTAPVTISAVPAFIALSVAPDTWTINNATGSGSGVIAPDTIYYSNPLGETTSPSDPVVDGECYFTITNTATVVTDVFVNIPNFTGGNAAMTNSGTGSNGATAFGAYSYCTGMTYSSGKVIAKASASDAMKADLAATTNLKFGVMIETQSDAWAGGGASTSVMVVSMAAA